MKPNTTEVSVGTGILFSEVEGHIAVITSITDTGYWVKEGDYIDCEITERFVEFDDYRIIGFYI
jgi:hypothetical protein